MHIHYKSFSLREYRGEIPKKEEQITKRWQDRKEKKIEKCKMNPTDSKTQNFRKKQSYIQGVNDQINK